MLELGDTDYNYHKWESVKGTCTAWLIVRLNVAHLIMLRKVKFYRHMYFSPNIVVRSLFHTVDWGYFSQPELLWPKLKKRF